MRAIACGEKPDRTKAPFRITVCGFEDLPRYCRVGASHVLSILDPGTPVPDALRVLDRPEQLVLHFDDVIAEAPDVEAPGPDHIAKLLAFARRLSQAAPAELHLLIHCHAGFSRSPAALALILAQALPALSPGDLAAEVLHIRPNAWPNLRVIEIGDDLLHRHGAIVEAARHVYRTRLEQQPDLADLMIENRRVRELEIVPYWKIRSKFGNSRPD